MYNKRLLILRKYRAHFFQLSSPRPKSEHTSAVSSFKSQLNSSTLLLNYLLLIPFPSLHERPENCLKEACCSHVVEENADLRRGGEGT